MKPYGFEAQCEKGYHYFTDDMVYVKGALPNKQSKRNAMRYYKRVQRNLNKRICEDYELR